jgi:hypothetical protein
MKIIILTVALSALALPAYADTTINGKVSTLGLGAEAAFPLAQSVDVRLGFNTFKKDFSKSTITNGLPTNYDGDLKLGSVEALADWHPMDSSFRVSGGLLLNNNKFSLTGQPSSGTINIGGVTYPIPPGASVKATVDFNNVAPYFGIGWGRSPKHTGLSFTSDVGVVFQGAPKSNITTTNIPDPYGTLAADTAKANADLKDELKNFNIYPVISFGIGYTF